MIRNRYHGTNIMALRIDAHQHFWDLSRTEFDYEWVKTDNFAAINKTFLPEHLQPHLTSTHIAHSVVVQTQHKLAENEWALNLAENNPFIAGVVGWVDLSSNECEEHVLALKENPKFVGIRHVTQDEPDENFIVGDLILRGLGVLEKHTVPFDLLFYVQHLKHAVTLGQTFPDLPLVIDHLAKPTIKTGEITDWASDLRTAAEFPNIHCKLSGLITEATWNTWTPADLRPYIETALEAFGPRRCMFGSDWPVCKLAGSYEQVYGALMEVVGDLSLDEQDWILGKTATEFYRLKLETPHLP
jgi:L-fuconolactonase